MNYKKTNDESTMFGTCFSYITINATSNQLKKAFGKPNVEECDDSEKVQKEWWFMSDDSKPFTIYDWKEYRAYGDDEVIEWHIGKSIKPSTTEADVKAFKNWVLEQIKEN